MVQNTILMASICNENTCRQMLCLLHKYLLRPQPQFHPSGLSVHHHPLVLEFQVVPIFIKYHKEEEELKKKNMNICKWFVALA